MSTQNTVTLRPLRLDDLELVHAWRECEHAVAHYGNAGSLEATLGKFAARVTGDSPIRCDVIICEARRGDASLGEAVGLVQSYRLADFPEWRELLDFENDAWGLDVLIGDPERLRLGIASAAVQATLARGPQSAAVYASPRADDDAGIALARRCGFVPLREVRGSRHVELVHRLPPRETRP